MVNSNKEERDPAAAGSAAVVMLRTHGSMTGIKGRSKEHKRWIERGGGAEQGTDCCPSGIPDEGSRGPVVCGPCDTLYTAERLLVSESLSSINSYDVASRPTSHDTSSSKFSIKDGDRVVSGQTHLGRGDKSS